MEEEIDRQIPFEAIAERLMAVPGLGKVGAWTILAEIGDITRFPSAKQFVINCRLAGGAKDSGGSHRHKSGNKDGNRYLRAAFGTKRIIKWWGNSIEKLSAEVAAR